MMLVAMNDFARRHTPESPFSHFEGSEEELLSLVTTAVEQGDTEPGYRDGVTLVNMHPLGFRCGVVELSEKTLFSGDVMLSAIFEKRREGEAPYLSIRARGEKAKARVVQVVIYRHDILAADGDNSTDAEWEIISINARPTSRPEPLTPIAMARNYLNMPGGTDAEYTAEDFAKAIVYWSTRCMVEAAGTDKK